MEVDPYLFREEDKIGRGTRSVCYREGDRIYKVMSGFFQEKDALGVAEELQKSRDILVHWLGDYVTPSKVEVSGKIGNFSIVTEQPFIDGVSMKKALEMADGDISKKDRVLDFLKQALAMYKNTNQVPDIFGRPHILGWYKVLTTPNVKVEIKDGILTPRLLDIGFARLSQNWLTGSIHNNLLANNIERAIEEIEGK